MYSISCIDTFNSYSFSTADEEYDGLETFSLHKLLVATDNFSDENVIGRGGHGTVYKGRLNNGSVVSVKRLQQQVIRVELEMLSLVIHRNVIKLIGFCITQEEQLLVYPFMQNGSVASCLRSKLHQLLYLLIFVI